MDGVLIDLLHAKWNTFVKAKFYNQFFLFAFYFIISLVCFTLRPGPLTNKNNGNNTLSTNSSLIAPKIDIHNGSLLVNDSLGNSTGDIGVDIGYMINDTVVIGWWENLTRECRLMDFESIEGQIRITAEILMEIGAILYITMALREAGFLGRKMFIENLVRYFIINSHNKN